MLRSRSSTLKTPHKRKSSHAKSLAPSPGTPLNVFLRSLLLGGLSGAVSKTIVAPLERIKVVRQLESGELFRYGASPTERIISRFPDFSSSGIVDCAKQIWEESSPRPETLTGRFRLLRRFATFYRGNVLNIVRYFPTQALMFGFRSQYRRVLLPFAERSTTSFRKNLLLSGLAGGLAGASALCFVYPLDFARTLLTSDVRLRRRYRSSFGCFVDVVRRNGLRGLYRGFGMSVRGVFAYRAFYFGGYDIAKRYVLVDDRSFWSRWCVSHTISILSQLATYPFDTVRRRVQLSSGDRIRRSAVMLAREISRVEGWKALYKGALANGIRASGAAISLVFYDYVGAWLFGNKDYGNL